MRNSILFLAIALILPLLLACDSENNTVKPSALTENDFVGDSSLSANLEDTTIVTFLESPQSEPPVNDTGTVGTDEIPVTYINGVNQRFCWIDDNLLSQDVMRLLDSSGEEVLKLQPNSDCVEEFIPQGDYTVTFEDDGEDMDTQAIFMTPGSLVSEEASLDSNFLYDTLSAFVGLIYEVDNLIHKDAVAQTSAVEILISTNRCPDCDLRKANLAGASLRFADLNGASLSDADLSNAELFRANLNNVSLFGANLTEADLFGAKMNNTSMEFATLTKADVSFAEMSNADMFSAIADEALFVEADMSFASVQDASFMGSRFDFAKLNTANISGADFSGATWCDSCVCDAQSIGECGGCSSQEVCTGP